MSRCSVCVCMAFLSTALLGCAMSLPERLAKSQRLFEEHQWKRAEWGYNSVLEQDPDNFWGHIRLAEILFDTKRYDIMIPYHLREAERIMKERKDPRMEKEYYRVRDKILGKALRGSGFR